MAKKQKGIPLGVKIISILSYIGSAVLLLFGIMALAGGSLLGAMAQSNSLLAMFAPLAAVLGVIVIALAVLFFFMGRGLWKGQSWARVVAIIFAVLGLLMNLMSLIGGSYIGGLFGIIVNGLIGWYLLFNVEAKSYFG